MTESFMDYAVPPTTAWKQPNQHSPTLVSLCSGIGGSVLGYRLAGFRLLHAYDVDPYMVENFNRHFGHCTEMDLSDIAAFGEKNGVPIDVVDMSPPDVNGPEDFDLIRSCLTLAARLDPKIIVLTTLPTLAQGRHAGYFLDIRSDLLTKGFVPRSFKIDAQWLGVPQRRVRLVTVAVNVQLPKSWTFRPPEPFHFRYSIREAITAGIDPPPPDHPAWLGETAVGQEYATLEPGEWSSKYYNLVKPDPDLPCPTITKSGGTRSTASVCHPSEPRKFTIPELRRLQSFPDDFDLSGTYHDQYRAIGQAVPPMMAYHLAQSIRYSLHGKDLHQTE